MQEPTVTATIQGVKAMPAGSRVTFAAKVIRCIGRGKAHACWVGDESGLIRVEGPGVERFKPGDNFRIEHACLKRGPKGEEVAYLDDHATASSLPEPVSVAKIPGAHFKIPQTTKS